MFGFGKKGLTEEEIKLWSELNRLAQAVHQISGLMKNMAISLKQLREDVDFLGQNVASLAEQQLKIQSRIMASDDLLDKIQSTTVH